MRTKTGNILRSFLILLFSILFVPPSFAVDTSFTTKYAGDFNRDGVTDYFYQRNDKIILIPMDDIITPILTEKAADGGVIVVGGVAQYTFPVSFASEFYIPHIGDFDGDGCADIFMQAKLASKLHHMFLSRCDVSNNFISSASSWYDGYQGVHWSQGTVSVTEYNGDTYDDLKITFTEKLGGGISKTRTVVVTNDSSGLFQGNRPVFSSESVSEPSFSFNRNDMAVGETSGDFQIGQDGSATYSMPIGLPPGRAGMQPGLSFNYNSNSTNGLLGIGWGIGGLTVIHRCTQNYAQDNNHKGLEFNSNDRLCLDGQRLHVTNGKTYGSIDSQYRTESDSLSRITLKGGDYNSGTGYFEVQTKSGQTYTYGSTPDSRLNPGNSTVAYMWGVNKIQDAVDINEINFVYANNSANGQFKISEINYPALTSINDKVRVKFNYEDRPDPIRGYLAGHPKRILKRLKQVDIQIDGSTEIVHSYELIYVFSRSSHRSHVKAIKECGTNEQCLPPVQFDWQVGHDGFLSESTEYLDFGMSDASRIYPADYNGDGYTDIGYAYAGNFVIQWGSASGFNYSSRAFSAADGWGDPSYKLTGDYNGDGLADIATTHGGANGVSETNSAKVHVKLSTGNTFVEQAWPVDPTWNLGQWTRAGDFNGDGLTDIVSMYGNQIYAKYSTGSGFRSVTHDIANINGTNIIWGIAEMTWTGDFNGDGLMDIMTHHGSYNTFDVIFSTGTGFRRETWYGNNNGHARIEFFWTGDFNGDGLTDIASTAHEASNEVHVRLSTGKGFDIQIWPVDMAWGDQNNKSMNRTGDVNGDGLTDLISINYYDGAIYHKISTGNGFRSLGYKSTLGWGDSSGHAWVGDFNGDGRSDFVYGAGATGSIFRKHLSTGNKPDVISSITDSLGNATSITYDRLNQGTGAYSRTAACYQSYPLGCVNGPMSVVSEYQVPDGVGGTSRYTSKYYDLVSHVLGRGVLGFGKIEKTDQQTNRKVITKINNVEGIGNITVNRAGLAAVYPGVANFPYQGMPIDVEKSINGLLLNKTTNTPAIYGPTNNIYFPYFASSTEANYVPNNDLTNAVHTSTVEMSNIFELAESGTYRIKEVTVKTTDHQNGEVFEKITDSIYKPDDITNWHLQRLSSATVTHSAFGDIKVRYSTFDYNLDGLITNSIEEPNNTALSVVSKYHYDQYGSKDAIETSTLATDSLHYFSPRKALTCFAAANDPIAVNTPCADINITGANSNVTPTNHIKTSNALGHSEIKTIDPRFGVATKLTGPNGLPTSWEYDGLGRKLKEIRADGTSTTVTRDWCRVGSGCPAGAEYFTATTSSGAAPAYAYYDKLNRNIINEGRDIYNSIIYKQTVFNNLGQAVKVSRNYTTGEALNDADYIRTVSDTLGRIQSVTDLSGTQATTSYSGLTTTVTVTPKDGAGVNKAIQRTIKENYANGKLWKMTDAEGGVTRYYYDAQGNLEETRAPNKLAGVSDADMVATTMQYDLKGRKIGMTDPDMGSWTYVYDAIGQLRKQTNAKLNESRFEYDQLGRKTLAIEVEGISKWVYDTASGKGTGKLHYVVGPIPYSGTLTYNVALSNPPQPGTVDEGPADIRHQQAYDYYGRAITTTTTIRSQVNEAGITTEKLIPYTMQTFYDDVHYGRVKQVIYPENIAGERLALDYTYDDSLYDYGYLTKVMRNNLLPDLTPVANDIAISVWRLGDEVGIDGAMNINGQITKQMLGSGLRIKRNYHPITGKLIDIKAGNSIDLDGNPAGAQNVAYVFDSLGNLEMRTDNLPDPRDTTRLPVVETFTYDLLRRLKTESLSGLPSQVSPLVTAYEYTASGNIKRRTDASDHYYHYDTAGPHAVGKISSDAAGLNSEASYNYDANGNMIGGGGRTIGYTSYNKPNLIIKGGKTTGFSYDAGHSRYLKAHSEGYIYYLGSQFERELDVSKTVKQDVHYLFAGGVMIGTYKVTSQETIDGKKVRESRFFLTDHIGSTSVITDAGGNVVTKTGYAAFGGRLDVANMTVSSRFTILEQVTQLDGQDADNHHWFTGHESLDDVGLIHMNGRVYDPELGRFISPDPIIQAPDNSQSFNRYSYVFNNPLAFTDPSGYLSLSDAWQVVLISNPATILFSDPAKRFFATHAWAQQAGSVVAGASGNPGMVAAWAAYCAYLNGGNPVKAAIIAGATAYAFQAAGEGIAAENVTRAGAGMESMAWYEEAFVHGVVGGITTGAAGGDARVGFASAFIGKSTTVATRDQGMHVALRGTIAVVTGGITAEMGGGKFKNGAATALMGFMFNEVRTIARQNRRMQQMRSAAGIARSDALTEKAMGKEVGVLQVAFGTSTAYLSSNPVGGSGDAQIANAMLFDTLVIGAVTPQVGLYIGSEVLLSAVVITPLAYEYALMNPYYSSEVAIAIGSSFEGSLPSMGSIGETVGSAYSMGKTALEIMLQNPSN